MTTDRNLLCTANVRLRCNLIHLVNRLKKTKTCRSCEECSGECGVAREGGGT